MIAYSHRLSLPFRSHTCRRVRSCWWQKSKRKLKISLSSPLNFPNPAEVLKFSQFRRRNLLTVLLLIMLVSKLQNFPKKIIKSSSVCHHQHHHHDSVSSSLWNEWKLIFFSLFWKLKTQFNCMLPVRFENEIWKQAHQKLTFTLSNWGEKFLKFSSHFCKCFLCCLEIWSVSFDLSKI